MNKVSKILALVVCFVFVFTILGQAVLAASNDQEIAWDGNFKNYITGDVVSYNGNTYACLQSHTSLATWNPVDAVSLWEISEPMITKKVVASSGKEVDIKINESICNKVSEQELLSIVNSNTNAVNLTILDVGYQMNSNTTNNLRAGITTWTPPIKTYTQYNVFESDRFMASCAKGETKTLSSTITEKLTAKVSGDIKFGSLDVTNEISYSLTKGQTLVGPPETSTYNSREFRCQFYQNKGNWVQFYMILGIPFTSSGTFTEPSKYISYSRDTYH